MKKPIFTILLTLTVTSFCSCHLEMSDNGDLDANWQLTEIDTIATGGVQQMKEAGTFWAFQFHMLQLRNGISVVDMRFKHESDSLFINDPYIDKRESGDQKLEDVGILRPFGINALEEHFYIRALDSEKMILKGDKLELYFRNY